MLIMLHCTTRAGRSQPVLVNLNSIRYARAVDTIDGIKTVLAFRERPEPFTGDNSVDDSRLFIDEPVNIIYERMKKRLESCQQVDLRKCATETSPKSKKPSRSGSKNVRTPTSKATP